VLEFRKITFVKTGTEDDEIYENRPVPAAITKTQIEVLCQQKAIV